MSLSEHVKWYCGKSCSPHHSPSGSPGASTWKQEKQVWSGVAGDWILTSGSGFLGLCFWRETAKVSATKKKKGVAVSQFCRVARPESVNLQQSLYEWAPHPCGQCIAFKADLRDPSSTQWLPSPERSVTVPSPLAMETGPRMTKPRFLHVLLQKVWFSIPFFLS